MSDSYSDWLDELRNDSDRLEAALNSKYGGFLKAHFLEKVSNPSKLLSFPARRLMTYSHAHPEPYEQTQDEVCECGNKWTVDGVILHGTWSPIDENDMNCPKCGRNILDRRT